MFERLQGVDAVDIIVDKVGGASAPAGDFPAVVVDEGPLAEPQLHLPSGVATTASSERIAIAQGIATAAALDQIADSLGGVPRPLARPGWSPSSSRSSCPIVRQQSPAPSTPSTAVPSPTDDNLAAVGARSLPRRLELAGGRRDVRVLRR